MSYSLGLTLYNLTGQPGPSDAPPRPDRPRGRLVWLHAPGAEALTALQELAHHLYEEDGVQTLITSPATPLAAEGTIAQPPPNDHPMDAQAFLDHWQPEVAIFAEGELFPALIHECAQRKVPLILVGGRAPRLPFGARGLVSRPDQIGPA